MKNSRLILLLVLIPVCGHAQFVDLKKNVLYIGNYNISLRVCDSINDNNGYPRQDALTWEVPVLDSTIMKYGVGMDRVSERYFKKMLIDILEYPVVRIPVAELTGAVETQLWDECAENNWNVYLKDNNFWMFNYNSSADNNFTQNQKDWVINHGGALWNFD